MKSAAAHAQIPAATPGSQPNQSSERNPAKIEASSHTPPRSHPIQLQTDLQMDLGGKKPAATSARVEAHDEEESSTILAHLKHTILNPLDAKSEVLGRMMGKEHYHHPSRK